MSQPAPTRTPEAPAPANTPFPAVAILTLGCKLNLADSEAMARRMRAAGWSVAERAAGADAVIVNTCSVTHVADSKSRGLVRAARRQAPGATLAVTGCMLETAPADVAGALGADFVLRQPQQTELTSRLIEMTARGPHRWPLPQDGAGEAGRATREDPGRDTGKVFRTRAFISAQEGCNDVCAFCIVPRTRGRERSKSIDAIVAEVRAREQDGVNEVVITGTQLGAWGTEQGGRGLYPLLEALLRQTSVPRIRMSSVQPQDLSPEIAGLWADSRLCRHLHLALQSGSEAVLRRMRRRYTAGTYRESVAILRGHIPGVAITTDVIAGFPGETEFEFEETLAFCAEMEFAGVHAFPYSPRLGTAAAKMPGQVPDRVKKERVHRLIALAGQMAATFRARFVGANEAVLWETATYTEPGPVWEGLTDTYVRVFAPSELNLANTIRPATIERLRADGLQGAL